MGRILAIDYGQKRTGIAVTDELKMIANGLTTVSSHDVFNFLKDYLSRENVECFVVGYPKQMNNMPSESVKYTEPFVKKLSLMFPGIEIKRLDERFTSKMAFQTMVDAGLRKKDRQNKGLVDTISAAILLQSYLCQIKK